MAHLNSGAKICDTATIFNSRGVAATGVKSIIQCFATDDFYPFPRTWYRETFACESASQMDVASSNRGQVTTSLPTQRPKTVTQEATETEKVTVIPTGGASNLRDTGEWGAVWVCVVPLVAGFVGVLLV